MDLRVAESLARWEACEGGGCEGLKTDLMIVMVKEDGRLEVEDGCGETSD